MNRRSFLSLALGALGLHARPSVAQSRVSLEDARKDESLRQDYLEQLGRAKGIRKIVYDHYYGESSCDIVRLIGAYQHLDRSDERAEIVDRQKGLYGQSIFTILDRCLFGLGNIMSSLYVAPPFFEQGYRISGGSIRIPVDEVDMADRLQVYRYSSNLDVSYALQLQDNLRSVQARGFPEDGFDYGSLSVLGKNDLSIVYGLVRLEAHMAVFPSNYRSINRFLASDALAEMRSLTRFLDSCGPRSKTVRGLLSRRSRSIRDVVQHASDEVQRQIDR